MSVAGGELQQSSARAPAIRRPRRDMRAHILRDVANILVDRPVDELNMQVVARLTGVSLWALRYHFGTFAGLFRAAAYHVVAEAEATLVFARSRPASVIDAIRCHAGALRDAMRSSQYRDMVYLVLRHGKTNDWLREAYDHRIVDKTCRDLTELVLDVSERLGAPVLFRDGVTRRLHRRVETEFALRTLLSPDDALPDDESEALLTDIVSETFLGTYCFDWQATNAA